MQSLVETTEGKGWMEWVEGQDTLPVTYNLQVDPSPQVSKKADIQTFSL